MNISQITLKTYYSVEELAKTFNGLNAIVSKTFYGKVCNVCYCNVCYILSLKVHEKAKNEICVIKYTLTLDHLFTDGNKISQILSDS